MQIVLDCDNTLGMPARDVDDGLALLYLLGCPEVELLGVTTTFGNCIVDQSYAHTRALLAQADRDDIRVLRGAGQRGQAPTEAAHFLAELAADHPGKVTLLATGPQTNVKAASEVDPNFFVNLRRLVCMGGFVRPVRVGRQVLDEVNFAADAPAATCVLSAPCPLVVMNAEVCLQASFNWLNLVRLWAWDRSLDAVEHHRARTLEPKHADAHPRSASL